MPEWTHLPRFLAHATKLFAREALLQMRVEDYARAVIPWGDQGAAEWQADSPCFGHCGVQPAEEAPGELGGFFATWVEAVFNEEWFSVFHRALRVPAPMLSIIGRVLTLAQARAGTAPAWMKGRVAPAFTALRGVAAVLSPEPLAHGAKQADVDFVFPSSLRRPVIHEELGKVGRMITALTRRNEEWGTAYRRYVEHHGAELAIGPKLANLARRLAPASGDGGVQPALGDADAAPLPEDWAAIVEVYTRDVPGWREALRPGALDALDAAMIPAVRLAWGAVQGLPAPDERVQRAAELQGALDQLAGSDARTLGQEIADVSLTWRDAGHQDRLDTAATLLQDGAVTEAAVREFLAAFKDGRMVPKPPALMAAVEKAISRSWTSGVEWLSLGSLATSEDIRTGVVALWQEVARQPQWPDPGQPFRATCALLASAAVALLGSMDAASSQRAAPSEANLEAVRVAIPPLRQELGKLRGLTPHPPAEAPVKEMLAAVVRLEAEVSQCYRDWAAAAFSLLLDKARVAVEVLAQVAGGGPDGRVWHDVPLAAGHENINAVYERTLGTINPAQIIEKQSKAEASMRNAEAYMARALAVSGPRAFATLTEALEEHRARARAARLRAHTTKLEMKLAQVFTKITQAEKRRSKVDTYVKEFAEVCGDDGADWRTLVHPDLRKQAYN